MRKLKVGVVGVGHLGSIHARIYSQLPGVELVGVADTNPRQAKAVGRKFSTPFYCDYRQLLPLIDAVSIAAPTSAHYVLTRDFLRAGVHVLVEKPITTSVEEAEILVKEAHEKKLILQVGHTERFNNAVETLTQLVKNPRFIECQRLGPFKRRSLDIGVVMDLMIHDLDILLALVNSPIKRLAALGVSVLTSSEDIANVRIAFANGTVASLTASRLSREAVRKIRIFQDNAYFSLDCLKQQIKVCRLKNNRITSQTLRFKKKEPLFSEIASFVQCVREGSRPRVSGVEGKLALEVALKISEKIKL